MPACSQGVDTWVFYLSEIRTWLNASGVARLYLPSNELIDSVCCYCNFKIYSLIHMMSLRRSLTVVYVFSLPQIDI